MGTLDGTVDLPDGRRLGFADVGDPAGAPLLHVHSNPGSPDPLDFDVDQVKLPVTIWHGTADTLVPIAQARHLASRLASATLVELPDVGHLHTPERVAQLAMELTRT